MRNPEPVRRFSIAMPLGALAMASCLSIGCGKEEPPPPAPEPKPVVRVDPMAGIELDARVQWPEDREAWSPELAQAIADLANAIARGDNDLLQSALSPKGRQVMTIALSTNGEDLFGGEVEAVRVCVLHRLEDGRVELGLGIQDGEGAYLTGWTGREQSPGDWVFEGAPCEAMPAERVSMLDAERLTPPSLGMVATLRVEVDKELRDKLSGESGSGSSNYSSPSRGPSDHFRMPSRRPR